MHGRPTASQIAAASAASVLLRLTYALTYCAGISRTSWPTACIAGNFRSLQKVHRAVERYWHKMLCSRSWAGRITWDMFRQIKQRQPILRPKLYLPYRELKALAVL